MKFMIHGGILSRTLQSISGVVPSGKTLPILLADRRLRVLSVYGTENPADARFCAGLGRTGLYELP